MTNSKPQFKSKLPEAGISIFAVMSRMAHEEGALNLSQGYPDFAMSEALIEMVHEAMQEGYNQYAPMPGTLGLRAVLSEKIFKQTGQLYTPEKELNITAGATQAIFTIISAFVHPGDEVIIFSPAYDCYDPSVLANGGKVIDLELEAPDFGIPWTALKAALNHKTRMVIVNTPHNPTGTIWTAEDMKKLGELLSGTNTLVLSDEVYEHLVYDGQTHQSAARFPKLAERSFVVGSFGKTFHNTGWKMGYCAAPSALMAEFRKIHQFNVFSVNHPIQRALAGFLAVPDHYQGLSPFFERKRDLFLEAIKDSDFDFKPSAGTYFQLLNFSKISEASDAALAEEWTRKYKLASIPVSAFYKKGTDPKYLRFCFAKSDETLLRGAEILNEISRAWKVH